MPRSSPPVDDVPDDLPDTLRDALPDTPFGALPDALPAELPAELVDHLCRLTRLDGREARRVVVEILAFMNETQHDFMRRRHRELQDQGLANAAIFRCIQRELLTHRFRATPVSERQIRRVIYG